MNSGTETERSPDQRPPSAAEKTRGPRVSTHRAGHHSPAAAPAPPEYLPNQRRRAASISTPPAPADPLASRSPPPHQSPPLCFSPSACLLPPPSGFVFPFFFSFPGAAKSRRFCVGAAREARGLQSLSPTHLPPRLRHTFRASPPHLSPSPLDFSFRPRFSHQLHHLLLAPAGPGRLSSLRFRSHHSSLLVLLSRGIRYPVTGPLTRERFWCDYRVPILYPKTLLLSSVPPESILQR